MNIHYVVNGLVSFMIALFLQGRVYGVLKILIVMKKIKGNFKLSRVEGSREIVSWFNVWDRAYRAYRFATIEGFDYVQLVRVRDSVVLYSDGVMPEWFEEVQ